MTEKLKCPICGKDLIEIEFGKRWFLACDNSKCRCKGVASYVVWQALITSKKAWDAIQEIKDIVYPALDREFFSELRDDMLNIGRIIVSVERYEE